MAPTPPPALSQGLMGLRRERGRVIRPIERDLAYPVQPDPFPVNLPCRTAAVPDKIFPGTRPDTIFPHPADMTPQQWVTSKREQRSREIGTSPRSCVRAFISPRSGGAVIYQIPSLYQTKLTSTGLSLTVDPTKVRPLLAHPR